jgi:hypothetical protein
MCVASGSMTVHEALWSYCRGLHCGTNITFKFSSRALDNQHVSQVMVSIKAYRQKDAEPLDEKRHFFAFFPIKS